MTIKLTETAATEAKSSMEDSLFFSLKNADI